MVGMFLGGQGRPCRADLADLGKVLNLGLKGEKGERRTGVEGESGCCFDEGACGGDWERERRVRRYLYIT